MAKRLGLAESIWKIPTSWGIYRELSNFRSVVCRTHTYIYDYIYIYMYIYTYTYIYTYIYIDR